MGFSNSPCFGDARQKHGQNRMNSGFQQKDLRTPMKPIGAVQKP
jgi:hypothetical protein